jgi:hypothetical protein
MTLIAELKKELRKVEQARKEFETKVATLKQKEVRSRQLAGEFSGPSAAPSSKAHRPLSEEHRRKISEALKRRHSMSGSIQNLISSFVDNGSPFLYSWFHFFLRRAKLLLLLCLAEGDLLGKSDL